MNDKSLVQTREAIEIKGVMHGTVNDTDTHISFTVKEASESHLYSIIHFYEERDDVFDSYVKNIKHGATCEIRGQIGTINEASNPGQFNYLSYLQNNGIRDQIEVEKMTHINCTGSRSLQIVYELKNNVIKAIDHSYSEELASWMKALVIGDDSSIDDSVIDLFQRWGLSHILAISGLHVGIVVMIIYFLFIRLNLLTKESVQTLLLIFLPFYALLAGSEPSVWRASLMISIVILFNKWRVRVSLTDLLSIVFLMILFIDKQMIYHIGFQFSFLVTLAILLSKDWLLQTHSRMFQLLQISFISQMIIIPLQLIYFHTFTPLSILVNVIIVPYFSLFVIPFTFICVIIVKIPLISPMLTMSDQLFKFVHNFVISSLEQIDNLLYDPFVVGDFSLMYVVVYYSILLFLMIFLERIDKRKALFTGVLLVALIMWLDVKPYFSPIGTVTMLDIGQGDAIVIELPYRKGIMFIDAGAKFSFEREEPTASVYESVIKPYLMSRGIRHVDHIFISHDHLDHNGSVPFIVNDFTVDSLYTSEYYEWTDWEKEHLSETDIRIERLAKGEKVEEGIYSFYVLGPEKDFRDANENSLIIYTKLGELTWVFTGDAEKNAENALIKAYPNLTANILKVGHHGSQTSTLSFLLDHLQPKVALISVGRNNMYGHPSKEVIDRLLDDQIKIFRTDEQGAIVYEFQEGKQGKFSTFLKKTHFSK